MSLWPWPYVRFALLVPDRWVTSWQLRCRVCGGRRWGDTEHQLTLLPGLVGGVCCSLFPADPHTCLIQGEFRSSREPRGSSPLLSPCALMTWLLPVLFRYLWVVGDGDPRPPAHLLTASSPLLPIDDVLQLLKGREHVFCIPQMLSMTGLCSFRVCWLIVLVNFVSIAMVAEQRKAERPLNVKVVRLRSKRTWKIMSLIWHTGKGSNFIYWLLLRGICLSLKQ